MSTAITIFGFFCVVVAVLWFVFKLYVAYDAARDPFGGGGVPTLDGAIFPPLALVLGLGAIAPDWPIAGLVLIWLAATAFGFAVHFALARFVKRRGMPTGDRTDESASRN